MIRTFITAAALAAGASLVAAHPVAAQSVEFKAIEAKKLGTKAKIDPAKGYILISAPARQQGTFIKAPDADEIAEYRADWDKQFDKARKRYENALKNWEKARSLKQAAGDKPVEPTRETFSIGDIERRMTVGYGPMFVFEKAENGAVSYLVEVEPGHYNYYGPVMLMPNGAAFGTCFCMGSVGFAVKPGVITNLGDMLALGWASDEVMKASSALLTLPEGRTVNPVSYPVPKALASYTVEPADWRAAGKMNNFYGITIARMPPVEGVLAYERDKVIDLKAR